MAQQRTLVDWLTGRAVFMLVADGYRRLRARLAAIPSFAAYESFAAKITTRVFGIVRLPAAFEQRVEPILEAALCRKIDPIIVFPVLALVAYLGIYPSSLGHLDTTPLIFTILPFISTFNPFLGFTSAVVFSVFDWIGKWLPFESVYGATIGSGWQNYFGARLGYIFAYSTVVLMGTLPGVLSRVLRLFAARLTAVLLKTPGVQAAAGILLLAGAGGLVWMLNPGPGYMLMLAFAVMATVQAGAPNPSWPLRLLEFAAGGVGGVVGALASGAWATNVGNQAAFISFRETPDISCRALSTSNYNNQMPYSASTGGVGGVVPPEIGNAVTPQSGNTRNGEVEPPAIKLPPPRSGDDSQQPVDQNAETGTQRGGPTDASQDADSGDPQEPESDHSQQTEPTTSRHTKPNTPQGGGFTATTGGPVSDMSVPQGGGTGDGSSDQSGDPDQEGDPDQQGSGGTDDMPPARVIGRCHYCGRKFLESWVTFCPSCGAGDSQPGRPTNPFILDPPEPGDNAPRPSGGGGAPGEEDGGDPEDPESDDGARPDDQQEQPPVDQTADDQTPPDQTSDDQVPDQHPADDQPQDDQPQDGQPQEQQPDSETGNGGEKPKDDAGNPPEDEDEEKAPEKKGETPPEQPPVTPVTPPADDAARTATPTQPVPPPTPPDSGPKDDAGTDDEGDSGDPDTGGGDGDDLNGPHQERVDGPAALKILTDLGLAEKRIEQTPDGPRIVYTIKDNVPGPYPDVGQPIWGAIPTNPGATIVTEEILDATGQNVLERAETPITGISGMSGLDQRVFIVGPNEPDPTVSIVVDLGAQRPFEAVGDTPSLGVGDVAAAVASGPSSSHLDSSRIGGGPNVPTIDPTPSRPATAPVPAAPQGPPAGTSPGSGPAPPSIVDALLTPSQQLELLKAARAAHEAGWLGDAQIEMIAHALGKSKEEVEFVVKDVDTDLANIGNFLRDPDS